MAGMENRGRPHALGPTRRELLEAMQPLRLGTLKTIPMMLCCSDWIYLAEALPIVSKLRLTMGLDIHSSKMRKYAYSLGKNGL